MEEIGTIASVIAAIATIATLIFSIRTSKGYILKKIDRKELQIMRINRTLSIQRRQMEIGVPISPLEKKRDKLENEVNELKRKL